MFSRRRNWIHRGFDLVVQLPIDVNWTLLDDDSDDDHSIDDDEQWDLPYHQ